MMIGVRIVFGCRRLPEGISVFTGRGIREFYGVLKMFSLDLGE